MVDLDIDIRIGTTDDMPFVADSWCKAMRHQYPNQYAFDFSSNYHDHIYQLLDRSILITAHLQGDTKEILGYLVYKAWGSPERKQIIHFAYTKADARQQGIMNKLIEWSNPEHYPIIFTHSAKNETIMRHLAKKYIYDPSILNILA